MKSNFLKSKLSRIAAIALSLVIVMSVCGCGSTDELSGKSQTGTSADYPYIYVNLGDSVAAAYNLDGDKTDKELKNGSYAQLLSEAIMESFGTADNPEQSVVTYDLSKANTTAEDLNKQLDDAEVLAKLQDAKIITIAVGSNDILNVIQDAVKEALGKNLGDGTGKDSFGYYLNDNIEDINESLFMSLADSFSNGNTSAKLAAAEQKYQEQMSEILDKVTTNNPTAQVFVINYYNPYKDMSIINGEKVLLNIGPVGDIYFNKMNEYLTKLKNETYTFNIINVSDFTQDYTNVVFNGDIYNQDNTYDPNPNKVGHDEIYKRISAVYLKA